MLETAVGTTATQERALDATLVLIARWGVAKTTLGDVAREAGMARATLYRAFPGGRDQLFALLAQREARAFLAAVTSTIDAADDLGSALVDGLHVAARHLAAHTAAGFVLAHEPELAVPVIGFGRMDDLLALVRAEVGPHLAPHGATDPAWAAEWAARLLVSALVNPTPAWDLEDRAVCARVVERYVLPALAASPAARPTIASPPTLQALPAAIH